ncbi:DUF4292 domain-containing protein [Terriglobus sp.]|uniref:DUF4292 domain-containing protein n=1 Tax=Terriglobus sp. TaxID=1889013 RepID=UPI003B0042D0
MPYLSRIRSGAVLCSALLLPLAGCFRSTRAVMQTHAPSTILDATLTDLLKQTDQRYSQIQTMNASIDIAVSTGGGKEGKVVDYSAFPGYLLLRKPGDLRVLLFTPVGHVQAVDMVTDGTTFTMHIPPRNRAITGTNAVFTPSANPLENLRPAVFFDSLLIRGAEGEDLVSETSDERIYQPDPTQKAVFDVPEYDLGIYHQVSGSRELKSRRVIHISRATLMPYQQDIYDEKGQKVTIASYEAYQKFGDVLFPSEITIQRPLDQLRMKLTIKKLSTNQTLEDDQFQLKLPANTQIQKLP